MPMSGLMLRISCLILKKLDYTLNGIILILTPEGYDLSVMGYNFSGVVVMFVRSANELALLVISRRKELGLSQSEVADRVGLKQKTISAFENKPESTKLDTLFRILSAVKLDLNGIAKEKVNVVEKPWAEEW